MRVDQLLSRSEGAALAAEVAALRTLGRFVAHGVRQESGGRISQFRFVMDEPAQTWELDRDRVGGGPAHEEYRDGVLFGADGPMSLPFERASFGPVRMAMPELMPQWGRGHESFSPMLVQRIGSHSLLFTVEHEHDPAFRATLVVDERDGIARRQMQLGESTILTEVRPLSEGEVLPPARFTPLTDWIRPDY